MNQNQAQPRRAQSFQFYLFDNIKHSFIALTDGVVLGRFKGDLHFPSDDLLSRKHCQFSIQGNEIYVEDLGATNPTRVNSAKIHPLRKRRLRINDVIEIGQQRFILTTQNKHRPGYTQDVRAPTLVLKGIVKEDGSLTLRRWPGQAQQTAILLNFSKFAQIKAKRGLRALPPWAMQAVGLIFVVVTALMLRIKT